MKFFALSAAAALASARHHHHHHDEDFMIQLDAKAELLSTAMSMTNSRSEARALLQQALHTLDGGHQALSQSSLESQSQVVSIPIDEKKSLNLKVSPTYQLDTVNSVTLKAFRKIVGYDTFESIRRKDRSETKDTADYYNVTVSMMVQRKPAPVAAGAAADPYNPSGAAKLSQTLDRGFPYDD